ncbi:hypothetical protein C8J46_103423 [Sphingomonas sp. PP-F2F-A104-K0414]|uniref:hypothetical protein n=1 Tax=Sphingomonas sp. PP-F2F-A104-K0414 TaxID=2135661 RepID=UPI001050E03B|nr:hypothetical protein [Sphingomonas sp. PP-F2F-A104-K0414]TCP99535.1 hypothetical protein C8J46_103423 [Sphingomonas sp. PP-F2F-A104-K0414]
MKRHRFPWVFCLAATLLLLSAVAGQWWQHQPAGEVGVAVLTVIASHCPAAVERQSGRIRGADSARALDRWGFARMTELVRRDGRDRCRRQD